MNQIEKALSDYLGEVCGMRLRPHALTGLAKAAIAAMQPAPQWQGIESAPDLERVIVAGWNPHSGNVRGYWWYGEDVVSNGRAIEHPRATHWRPFNNPAFPTPPAGGSDAE